MVEDELSRDESRATRARARARPGRRLTPTLSTARLLFLARALSPRTCLSHTEPPRGTNSESRREGIRRRAPSESRARALASPLPVSGQAPELSVRVSSKSLQTSVTDRCPPAEPVARSSAARASEGGSRLASTAKESVQGKQELCRDLLDDVPELSGPFLTEKTACGERRGAARVGCERRAARGRRELARRACTGQGPLQQGHTRLTRSERIALERAQGRKRVGGSQLGGKPRSSWTGDGARALESDAGRREGKQGQGDV